MPQGVPRRFRPVGRVAVGMTPLEEASRKALAAVQVARKEKFLKPLRAQLYRVAALHFSQQSDALLGALRRRGHVLNETVCREELADDIDGILGGIFAEYRPDFADAMRRIVTTAMGGAVRHRLADFDAQINFDLENPMAQEYLGKYCADQVSKIDETTRKSVKGVIVAGENNGKSYSEIAREIVKKFDSFGEPVPQKHLKNRAETIAVYELGQAYESAGNQTVAALQSKGLPMVKSSSTAADEHVCDLCRANEAEGWIPFDQPHQSGHMHPNFHIGDRCAELYELDSDAAEKQLAG